MKRISSPDSAYGHPLRAKMILFFLAASATILTVTAINLYVFLELNGVQFSNLTPSDKHFSSSSHLAIALLILLSLCGVALIAWLTVTITSALNTMAESLHKRFSSIKTVHETLASIDTSLEMSARQIAQAFRIHESGATRATPSFDSIANASGRIAECFTLLEQSAASTNKAVSGLVTTSQGLIRNSDKLGSSFGEVNLSTSEMAISLKELSAGIVNLLSVSGSTAASVVKMDFSLNQIEKIAQEAAAISENITTDAETGMRATEETISGMLAILNSSHTTSEAMQNLSRRVDDIGVILAVIEDVAEQTGLLALNATILAAQAGEYGKGFAVVADEIRELSERTSSSTREISSVIRGVQNETRLAVDAIQQAEVHITAGQKLSRRSGTALEKIVRGVQQISAEVLKIARTTAEQARDSQIIKESIQNITKMVQQIAAASTEHTRTCGQTASAMERLKALTSQIRSSVGEQVVASDLVALTSRDTLDTIDHIRSACSAQTLDNATVKATLDETWDSFSSSAGSVITLERSLATFEKQLKLLKNELSDFTV